ncbi:hypothetical protein EMN47_00930 [Prolixibacteraceae bacterium JC049]|nr:hypothetical protein [Prolixibacteraceae bacterium JC049]
MKQLFLLTILFILSLVHALGGEEISDKKLDELFEQTFLMNGKAIRFDSNILIQLNGDVKPSDVIFTQELARKLRLNVEKWDVDVVGKGSANVVLHINETIDGVYSGDWQDTRSVRGEIVKTDIYLDMGSNFKLKDRERYLYYKILKNLAVYPKKKTPLVDEYPGSVFAAKSFREVTFDSVDFKLIKKLYSKKYSISENKSPVVSFESKMRKNRVTVMFFHLLNTFLSILLLLIMLHFNLFKRHGHRLNNYLFQAGLLVGVLLFYLTINIVLGDYMLLSSLQLKVGNMFQKYLIVLICLLAFSVLATLVMFYVEKAVLERRQNFVLSIAVPFVTTLFIPGLLLMLTVSIFSGEKNTSAISAFGMFISGASVSVYVAVLRAFFIYLNRKSESIIHKKDVEIAQLGEMHKHAELQSLRSKINPHFLYNSLNSIASLATIDGEKAEAMALALSDFFKYSINREQKELNSISDELNMLKTYLEIEKVRFGEKLQFEVNCPEELMEIKIPSFLIQPLVENAVKHGVSQLTEQGKIMVNVLEDGKMLKIRVYDNGPAFPKGPLVGHGIKNTSERLELQFGKKAWLDWNSDDEKYVEIRMPIQLLKRS